MNKIFDHIKEFQSIYASLISACALYFIFYKTVKNTFKFHKSEKLAEIKLNVYLDLTARYTDYLLYIHHSKYSNEW